jgi:uncharacterized protein YjbI with pentapeptide repeats
MLVDKARLRTFAKISFGGLTMADKKQLARLKKGVEEWNAWRKENPTIEIDLSLANLCGGHLAEANLVWANLRRVDLHWAKLEQADLDGANLDEASFAMANLELANFRKVNLSRTVIAGANLEQAIVGQTSFVDIDLSEVKGLATVRHIVPSTIGIDTIYKSKGNIPEVFLRGCGVPEDMIAYARSLRGKTIDFYSCFISHSAQDKKFCERLYADLQAKGVRIWYFPEDAKWGATVWGEIDRSIKIYDKLVVVLSEHSLQSKPVLREIQRSLDREDKEHKNILFPIRIDDYVFAKWEHERKADVVEKVVGDFSGWDKDAAKYDKAFEKLLRGLQT